MKISQVCGRTQFWKSNKSPKSKWEFMKSVQLLLSSLPISNEEEIQKFKSVTAWSDLVFKTAKKISLKPLLLYILYNYYNWQLEFLCAYDVRFQSVYNGRNFKKKKFCSSFKIYLAFFRIWKPMWILYSFRIALLFS